MDLTAWATFWAAVSFFLLIALFVYMKVPGMVTRTLDQRAERIREELDEARKLREDAQQLLAEYQRKRQEAEKEASDIVAAAEREAELMNEEARQRTEDYVARRTALAENKIEQAERDAVNEVRSRAVDIAVAAAGRILADKVDDKLDAELFEKSLGQVSAKLQ